MQRARKGQLFVLLAPGFEESDVTTVTRTLRRSGFPVMVVGLTAGPIRGSFGLSLAPDGVLSAVEADLPPAVVLPGGVQGARQLNADPRVHALLRRVVAQGGYVVALDTSYTILRSAGVLNGGGEERSGEAISGLRGETPPSERIVVEGQLIFGRDPGTAQEAALTLVALLEGRGWMGRSGW
jgi:4-methyl-5(b-hydroxyethyl)-thiazole monophosphate biosynthesis